MEQLFNEAHHKRRNTEYILTSRYTNAVWYGSPAWAKKSAIWPPLTDGPVLDSKEPLQHGAGSTKPTDASSAPAPPPSPEVQRLMDELSSNTEVLYHPLHHGNMIRVLEIQPGQFDDKIVSKFRYADLASAHLEYEALSYVWSKPRFTWQKPSDMPRVETECNGHPLWISKNLEQAVRHIRLPSAATFLWADAMCINQDDIRERGHQVTLMTSIYQKAKRVVIWLGDVVEGPDAWKPPPGIEDVRAQRAFGAICEVVNRWQDGTSGAETASYTFTDPRNLSAQAQFCQFEEYPSVIDMMEDPQAVRDAMEQWRLMRPKPQPRISMFMTWNADGSTLIPPDPPPEPADKGLDSDETTAKDSLIWMAFSYLFSLSWFWRVWVIQEAILARSAVVKWGHAEIDWKWIGLASALLRTNYHKICEATKISGVYNAYFMYRMSPLSDLPPPQLSFIQLLRLTRQFEVTDARDRVYGLLGIQTTDSDPASGTLFLEPDYSISEPELWKRLAVKIISATGTLNLLSSVQYTTEGFESGKFNSRNIFDKENKPRGTVPTWVPLWDIVYRATLAPWDLSDRFSASKGMPLSLQSPLGADNLVVEGIQIGVVGKCCPYMWHDADFSLLESSAMLGRFFASDAGLRLLARTLTGGRDWYGSLVAAGGGDDDDDGSSLADLAAHVLDCHANFAAGKYNPRFGGAWGDTSWRPETSHDFGRAFDAHPHLERRLRELAAAAGDAARFRETAIPVCERRRLLLTLDGWLALGPDCVLEGDVLCVLAGADLPFVLRHSSMLDRQSRDNSRGETESTTEGPANDYYILVGECYVEGLMQGEAVASLAAQTGALTGPVPPSSLVEDILSEANEPEEVISQGLVSEIERTKHKQKRLDSGHLFTPDMAEALRQNETEKRWFDIH